jgi:hypothetical protein
MRNKWLHLSLLNLATLFSLTLWFSGSAVTPQLTAEWAFSVLALGPLFGVISMLRLRRLPEAAQMAGGNR